MTTTYTGIPSFEERIAAATIAIVGRVGEIVETSCSRHAKPPVVRTTFRVEVEAVLKGSVETGAIEVQVTGGTDGQVETPFSVALQPGERALLMLAPNHVGHPRTAFVPYFASAYTVSADGAVTLTPEVAAQLARQGVAVDGAAAALADLRPLFEAAAQRQQESEARFAQSEPLYRQALPPAEPGPRWPWRRRKVNPIPAQPKPRDDEQAS